MKKLLLVDFYPDEKWTFGQLLKKELADVEVRVCESNQARRNIFVKGMRFFKYFLFPLKILFIRRKYDLIIGWQQFYALNLVFWLRLIHAPKTAKIVVMTFIYKPKAGFLGWIYRLYMKFICDSIYIDKFIVFSREEVSFYSKELGIKSDKLQFLPYGEDFFHNESDCQKGDYVFCAGRSNRDYDFLIKCFEGNEKKLVIACDTLVRKTSGNILILNNCFSSEMGSYMAKCFCVVLPLKNLKISSGQLVALQAMSLGKPIIATNAAGIADYIENEKSGFLINNDVESLQEKINLLYNDSEMYNRMSAYAKSCYQNNFTLEKMALNVVRVIEGLK